MFDAYSVPLVCINFNNNNMEEVYEDSFLFQDGKPNFIKIGKF